MPTWLRAVLILVCILLIWWLAIQFGEGISEDPEMQAPLPDSGRAVPVEPSRVV